MLMKKSISILLVGLLILVATGCQFINGESKVISGNGDIKTQTRQLEKAITGVRALSVVNILFDKSLSGTVIIEADSNLLDVVEVNQRADGVVEIGIKQNTVMTNAKTIQARVPYSTGGLIETASTGSISINDGGSLSGDTFDLRCISTGSIQLNIQAKKLTVIGSSTGNVILKGTGTEADITLSSTGTFQGQDFSIQKAKVTVSGVGSAHVKASDSLGATITGLGNIVYSGSPSITSSVTGLGQLKKQ